MPAARRCTPHPISKGGNLNAPTANPATACGSVGEELSRRLENGAGVRQDRPLEDPVESHGRERRANPLDRGVEVLEELARHLGGELAAEAPLHLVYVDDEDAVNVGDVVRGKVLDVNTEAKRISLSRKEALLEEDPALAEQLAAEKAERDRQYAERQEQRQQQRDSQQSQQVQQPRAERPERAPRSSNSDRSSSRDSGDRRRRNNEDGDYELPPVQEAKTSLASLFEGLKVDE